MSTIVTMTSTAEGLTSGQTYRVRSKTAERLIANNKATKSPAKKLTGVNAHNNEGK